MKQFSETALRNLARAASAMGRVIEAHADGDDCVRKVVVELSAPVQNSQIREDTLDMIIDQALKLDFRPIKLMCLRRCFSVPHIVGVFVFFLAVRAPVGVVLQR